MDRRRVLLIAAALVAALGTVLVFLYVQGADNRAEDKFATVEVLVATVPIQPGETVADAAANAKFSLEPIAEGQVLPGALTTIQGIDGQVALTTIYPGEQIVPQKFGTTALTESTLPIPEGSVAMSANLTDPARVAGFVNPGSKVAVLLTGTDPTTGAQYSRVLLDAVTVIGVGSTTPVTTTTTPAGTDGTTQTVEALPRTLLTFAVKQKDWLRLTYAQTQGELSLALIGPDTQIGYGPGVDSSTLFDGQ
ncbi:unannotated protein [freshwater metagenome]|uniref:Unannotated protein n=1 Tax=freshwater metagenome TaxID=449393 RepID=A0A6J6Q1V5_9ZZZZ